MREKWTPAGWRAKPAKHIPTDYPDPEALARVEQQLIHGHVPVTHTKPPTG